MSDLDDLILDDPDSTELLTDSIAKAYINASPYDDRNAASDKLTTAIVKEQFAYAGWLLSNMIYANVREQAKKENRSEH